MSEHIITDWAEVTPSIFDGVNLDDREAVNARSKEYFDTHKASRSDMAPHLKHAYNSTLHEAIGRAARAAKQAKSAVARVEKAAEGKTVKGKLKQHIREQAKAKADATLLTDAVLAQLEELGVDLTPLRTLTEEKA